MEQGRVFLAIALSFLIFLVWGYLFPPDNPPVTPSVETQSVAKPKAEVQPTPGAAQAIEASTGKIVEQDLSAAEEAREIRVSTPLYRAVLSSRGAVLNHMELIGYRETVEPDSPLKVLVPSLFPEGLSQISYGDLSAAVLSKSVFRTSSTGESIQVERQPQSILFSWNAPNGIMIVKQYTFHPDSYIIDLDVRIVNQSGAALNRSLAVQLDKAADTQKKDFGFVGLSALLNDKLEQITESDAAKKPETAGLVQWMALEERYFMAAVVPEEPTQGKILLRPENQVLHAQLISSEKPLDNGAQLTQKFRLYFGPKSLGILKSTGLGLDRAIHFGMFDILAKPFLWIMNTIYSVVPNYGIAIIILTILVKAVLWPLGTKSYQSMAQMKKMQPLLVEIRNKYKDDKKRMNEETMALYKTYKVNPMGGCLPMIVQIPVFFALYRMLYEAIELRHAPFFGWITDLSAPDRLFHFPFSIPFMEPPYGIPVLTLVMGVTMFLQQKMSPPAGDPTQAKMMMAMPIVFTVIFINFSSGLVLYWLINNIISIGQQYMIQKKYQ